MRAYVHTHAAAGHALLPRCVAGGEAAGGLERFEVYCNPNAHASVVDARALITLRTREGVSVVTEGKLASLRQDVEAYLEAVQEAAAGAAAA